MEIEQLEAHEWFLALERITIVDLEAFVDLVQPGARLRVERGMDVRVGNHVPPPGGPDIRGSLKRLLYVAGSSDPESPYKTHCLYEILHPFTDGNGRSGRVLWLWMMGGIEQAPLGFLHTFYYQTLERSQDGTHDCPAKRKFGFHRL